MRIAYFDCPSGASGDMILGALVDAGCPLASMEKALRMLDVPGWRLEAQPVERGGLRGTHLVVQEDGGPVLVRAQVSAIRHAREHCLDSIVGDAC